MFQLTANVKRTTGLQDLINGLHGKFDVVFTEIFSSDCFTAIAYKLKVSRSVQFRPSHSGEGQVKDADILKYQRGAAVG